MVRAYNNDGESVSAVKTFRTQSGTTRPTAPSNLRATNITQNSATLTWSDNSNNETAFKIYRSGSSTPIVVPANTTSRVITGLSPNTSYTYMVRAYNNDGESASVSYSFRTNSASTESPEALYRNCSQCHGADGKTIALGRSAIIAGQSSSALEMKLLAYKEGRRDETGYGMLMKGQLENKSNEDIKVLADYISGF